MSLKTNASLRFEAYRVLDEGIEMEFVALDPGPGEESVRRIKITDTELGTIASQAQLRNLVISKLQRKERALNIASKLDQFIGQQVTV